MLKRIRRIILYTLLTLVLSFLSVEILLRLFFPQYLTFVTPDDRFVYRYRPGAAYVVIAPENCPDWRTSGTINQHGLVDDEHSYEVPEGTFRILALGDSYTEGLQFEREARWTDQLEAMLNEDSPQRSYEIINAGRQSTGTSWQRLYYVEEGDQYDADLVMLLFIANDLLDNSPELLPQMQPYYVLEDGRLRLDTSFRQSAEYQTLVRYHWVRQNSVLVSFLRQQYVRVTQQAQQEALQAVEDAVAADHEASALEIQRRLDALDITEAVLRQLSEDVRDDGAQFVFVIGTVPDDLIWQQTMQERYPDTPGMTVDQALERFAQDAGIPVLNLVPLQADYVQETGNRLHGCAENGYAGHWNRLGHDLATEWMADFLREEGFLPDMADNGR